MTSKNKKQFRIEWHDNVWVITDRQQSKASGIKVDGAVVSATQRGDAYVEGYIVAVHGLNLENAQGLDRFQLAELGVGGHLRGNSPGRHQTQFGKVHLMADGQIQGGRCDRGYL